jgi:hypothetical protein
LGVVVIEELYYSLTQAMLNILTLLIAGPFYKSMAFQYFPLQAQITIGYVD